MVCGSLLCLGFTLIVRRALSTSLFKFVGWKPPSGRPVAHRLEDWEPTQPLTSHLAVRVYHDFLDIISNFASIGGDSSVGTAALYDENDFGYCYSQAELTGLLHVARMMLGAPFFMASFPRAAQII